MESIMNAGNHIPAATHYKQQSRPQRKELDFYHMYYLKHYNLTSHQTQKTKLRAARCEMSGWSGCAIHKRRSLVCQTTL